MELLVNNRIHTKKNTSILRKEGIAPGVVYGKHLDKAVQVQFNKGDFLKLYKAAGTSTVVDLKGDFDGMVLIHDIQTDYVTNTLLHVDFLAVSANEEVSAEVPVIMTGESPLVKLGEGRVELAKDRIAVIAFPRDLPSQISLDISNINNLQDGIFIRDIDLGSKVKIDEDADLPVVVAVAITQEEPEAPAAAAAAEATPTEPAK